MNELKVLEKPVTIDLGARAQTLSQPSKAFAKESILKTEEVPLPVQNIDLS